MSKLNNDEFRHDFIGRYRNLRAVRQVKSDIFKTQFLKQFGYLQFKRIDPFTDVNTPKKYVNTLNYRRKLRKVWQLKNQM